MRIIIAGLRDYADYKYFSKELNEYLSGYTDDIELISGGATGVDSMAERYARENKIPIKVFPADWKKYGKAAGPIRNSKMADYAGSEGRLIAFWDGKSRGTGNMIRTAERKGIKVTVVNV